MESRVYTRVHHRGCNLRHVFFFTFIWSCMHAIMLYIFQKNEEIRVTNKHVHVNFVSKANLVIEAILEANLLLNIPHKQNFKFDMDNSKSWPHFRTVERHHSRDIFKINQRIRSFLTDNQHRSAEPLQAESSTYWQNSCHFIDYCKA